MKNLFFLSLLLTLVFSCGKDKLKKQDPGFSFGSPLSTNRPLSESEKVLGVEACELLKGKREYFETFEDNKVEFDFKAKEQICGQRPASLGDFVARLSVPSRGPLTFKSNFYRFIDEVLTDKNGFFSHYCDKLLVGDPTNIILPVGGKKVELKINRSAGKIKIETAWFYPDDNGIYKAYEMDGAVIHTTSSTRNRKFYGLALTRAQARPCEDGSVKFLEQELKVK